MAKKKRPEPTTYTGLIVAECEHCGEVTVFVSEEEAEKFCCRHCRKTAYLDKGKLSPLISTCECGNRIRGVTNSTKKAFQFNCKCGYPNSVEYSKSKNKYFGMI